MTEKQQGPASLLMEANGGFGVEFGPYKVVRRHSPATFHHL
jgi:hypothetical protein